MLKELIHAAVWATRHIRGQLKPPELELLAPLIAKGAVCLDIGAHAGAWLFPLGRLVGPTGCVVGFEALPYYARVLRWTQTLVGTSNVTVRNLAVTEGGASVQMIWQDATGSPLTGRTHIAGKGDDAGASVEVGGTTIDAACASLSRQVTFVKLDIEGAELGALRGGLATLSRHRPVVFTEVVEAHLNRYGHTTEMLFSFFQDLDYRPVSIAAGQLSPTDPDLARSFNDILFVPAELTDRALALSRSA